MDTGGRADGGGVEALARIERHETALQEDAVGGFDADHLWRVGTAGRAGFANGEGVGRDARAFGEQFEIRALVGRVDLVEPEFVAAGVERDDGGLAEAIER